jgi:hypothetical protein
MILVTVLVARLEVLERDMIWDDYPFQTVETDEPEEEGSEIRKGWI